MSYPGHCRLLLVRRGTTIQSNVNDALCDDGFGRCKLLSSDLYVNTWTNTELQKGEVQHDRVGPSIPISFCRTLHADYLHALRYDCPNILLKWASRPRHWPPSEAVYQVISLGAFLSPVGFKGIDYQGVEWRVCLTPGRSNL
ncbi:hypothetical protein DPMN_038818 [Dreissena polymorpha]|uniref:Uncharacterized protein n=1 Tax=Dreissena polymorpha TaxID=45954 RepID=A0A9D4RR20_DREPO|nr:hypothetical protein DPMN_038818 [Dreissena polymorpha]